MSIFIPSILEGQATVEGIELISLIPFILIILIVLAKHLFMSFTIVRKSSFFPRDFVILPGPPNLQPALPRAVPAQISLVEGLPGLGDLI